MRFYDNGPNIPNELLDARDNGEVVFFCGAGVSIPAGLPSFAKLAQQLTSDLGVPENASSRRLLERALAEKEAEFAPRMDLILDILQREYGSSQVESAVSRKLRTPKNPKVSCHEFILRLSTNLNGKSRLITTNFDLLFERAQPKLKRFAPPYLPDLTQDPAFEGIVYLHGRIGRRPSERIAQRIILGEGDFGRAYLADGWASEFLRQLLAHYTVVLLGYSADDPPVRYMLKGVQSRPAPRSQQIYAFAEGLPGEVESRWADRGVTAIPYQPSDSQHLELWNTLHSWGERARNPAAWRSEVLELARQKPTTLAAYQRGQVAALVRSTPRAKVFADAVPPPSAEWLCIFDAGLRYAEPRRDGQDRNEITFEPLEAYGLDHDPPRELGSDQKTVSRGHRFVIPDHGRRTSPELHTLGRRICELDRIIVAPTGASRKVDCECGKPDSYSVVGRRLPGAPLQSSKPHRIHDNPRRLFDIRAD